MKKLLKPIVLLAALILAGAVQAETLLDAYNKAKRNDPAIREAEANMLAQMQAKPRARALLLPQLDASAGWQNNDSDGTSNVPGLVPGTTVNLPSDQDVDTTDWSIDLSQTLFDLDLWRKFRKSDKEVAQAQVDYRVAEQDLMLRVTEAYFDVLAAQDTLTSEQAAKDAIGRQLEQAERRFEVGLIAITDVKEAQAAYDDATALEITARRSLANSKEVLREITGEYPQKLANPGKEFPLIPPAPQVEQDWVDISMQQNLALESAKIGAEITRDNVSIARTGHLPTLDFSASYGNRQQDGDRNTDTALGGTTNTDIDSDTDTTTFGVQFRLPIFSGGGVSADVQEKVYLHRAARENYEKVGRQTERETRDAYLGVIAEIARVRALARSEDSNRTALEATEAGYEVGTRTTVDVLDARRSLFLAQTQYARSKYDYLINVVRLKQAAGTLNPDDIQLVNTWLVTTEELPETPGRGAAPDVDFAPAVIEGAEAVPMEEANPGAQTGIEPVTEPGETVEP